MALTQRLIDYIQTNLVADGARTEIDANTELLDSGTVDSMGLMQLVMFIEEQTGVRVPDEEVMPDNFQTVSSMVEMIEQLRAGRS